MLGGGEGGPIGVVCGLLFFLSFHAARESLALHVHAAEELLDVGVVRVVLLLKVFPCLCGLSLPLPRMA